MSKIGLEHKSLVDMVLLHVDDVMLEYGFPTVSIPGDNGPIKPSTWNDFGLRPDVFIVGEYEHVLVEVGKCKPRKWDVVNCPWVHLPYGDVPTLYLGTGTEFERAALFAVTKLVHKRCGL